MLTKETILQKIREHRTEIERFGVKRLALFGSFARGESDENSDLDFLVELRRKTFDAYFDLKEYLETLLGRRVDLVLFGSLKPRLKDRVMGELVDAA